MLKILGGGHSHQKVFCACGAYLYGCRCMEGGNHKVVSQVEKCVLCQVRDTEIDWFQDH